MKLTGASGALGPVGLATEKPTTGRSTTHKNSNEKTDGRDPKVLEASRLYESQFLREMVRAMRKTVPESDFMAPNMAEKIYREQMDDNFVDSWVDGGGVGLGDMIYDQLMQRYPELKATDKKTLPIQPSAESNNSGDGLSIKGKPLSLNDPRTSGYEFSTNSIGRAAQAVAPVLGTVDAVTQNDQGTVVVQINHDLGGGNSLKSTISFAGTAAGLKVGARLQPGDRLGTISPDSGKVLWALKKS